MKILKLIAIILLILTTVGAVSLDLLALAVGNGSLGSSFQQKVDLTVDSQKQIAYKLYQQSCATPILIDDFAKGMSPANANDCNNKPNPGGIDFIGHNGDEMYLLSHQNWDLRVLYATYYLLERGFDGPEAYSLRMDCSAPGFEPRPKMTLGVHYERDISGQVPTISFINSIENPVPNRQTQYIQSEPNGQYSPEGSQSFNTSNSISPHAYGQALDVYTYGCTTVYDRLDSDESAAKWACGKTGPVDPASPVAQHSYFYPIRNIPIEIEYADSVPATFSSTPDNPDKPVDPHLPYKLDPRPGLTSCSGTPAPITVQDTCYPFVDPIKITYTNRGCIAQNQPSVNNKYYGSKFFYGLDVPLPEYLTGQESRVQPFQFKSAVFIPGGDECTCISEPVGSSVPETEAADYQSKIGPIDFTNPKTLLTIPPEQQKGLSDDDLKTYLQSQAEASRKIVLEASMLFSIRQNDSNKFAQAEEYFKNLIRMNPAPTKQMLMNQIASPTIGLYKPFPDGYNQIAKLLYGSNKSNGEYDATLVTGHERGMGYNSTDKDRIHLGF